MKPTKDSRRTGKRKIANSAWTFLIGPLAELGAKRCHGRLEAPGFMRSAFLKPWWASCASWLSFSF
jgi:hypothetical protein